MKADTLTAIAAFFSNPLLWPLCIDGALILVLLTVKMFLLAGTVILVSRNEAHRSRKFFAFTVILLAILNALLNPSDEPAAILRGLLGCLVVATLLIRKVCWIDIEKALLAASLYCTLSVAIDIYSAYGLDLLIAERPTIDRTLAARIDARTRLASGDDTIPASHGVVEALSRQSASAPDDGGIAHTLLAPFRAGVKAKEKVDQVNKIATDQASVVNMLSGAGTNVGSGADELAALRNQLSTEAGGATPSPPSIPKQASPQNTRPPPSPQPVAPALAAQAKASTPSDPGAAIARAITAGLKKLPAPGAGREKESEESGAPDTHTSRPSEQPGDTPAISHTTARQAATPNGRTSHPDAPLGPSLPRESSVSEPDDPKNDGLSIELLNTQVLAKVSLAARQQWVAACASIKVSAAGRSGNNAYVLVNGQFIAVGSVYSHDFGGASYRFRLRSVNAHGQCGWEPALEQVEEEEANLIRF